MKRTDADRKLARALLGTSMNDNFERSHPIDLPGDRTARIVVSVAVVVASLALGFVLGGLR